MYDRVERLVPKESEADFHRLLLERLARHGVDPASPDNVGLLP
jgi:hypothetical protein